ncbi:MAG: hypothetical protein WC967_13185 [Balneolaceae bacterium]
MEYIKELLPNLFLLGLFVVFLIAVVVIISVAWLVVVSQILVEFFGTDDISKLGGKKYLILLICGPAAWVIYGYESWTSYLMKRS